MDKEQKENCRQPDYVHRSTVVSDEERRQISRRVDAVKEEVRNMERKELKNRKLTIEEKILLAASL